jgi:PhnB protein
MADSKMWDAPDIVPAITYSDVPRAVEWFQRVFGFRERVEARLEWPGGSLAWIEVGDSLFSLTTLDETWPKTSPGTTSTLMMKVYVDDVDSHFARAKSEGATIVSDPQDGFWGGRIYRALDHEGNRWEISQRGRDLAAELWELPPGVTRGAQN